MHRQVVCALGELWSQSIPTDGSAEWRRYSLHTKGFTLELICCATRFRHHVPCKEHFYSTASTIATNEWKTHEAYLAPQNHLNCFNQGYPGEPKKIIWYLDFSTTCALLALFFFFAFPVKATRSNTWTLNIHNVSLSDVFVQIRLYHFYRYWQHWPCLLHMKLNWMSCMEAVMVTCWNCG